MKLDEDAKQAVQNIGDAINAAVSESSKIAEAIEYLRSSGYEPHLTLKLEIALEKIDAETEAIDFLSEQPEETEETVELELTEEDLRTLQRMKIRF
ncbi:MAG: hypothetical protein JWN60_2069 [Acidobacteria bacterium]|jgi:hypothetical protein|nr:hypothetical protein [Acidobacteriota bacterium]